MSAQLKDAPGLSGPPDEHDDTLADQLFNEYKADPVKVAEADERWEGTLDGAQYSAIEAALADLHAVDPADLIGSDVLARLYQLARACDDARTESLREMAQGDADDTRAAMADDDCDPESARGRRWAA